MNVVQELIKFLTQRFVQYLETPRDERRKRRQAKEPWTVRWFGMIPLSLRILIRR